MPEPGITEVNGHVHTPYSFSSFFSMSQIFEQALKENVRVLGINDFFMADGYNDFYELALDNRIFPLFNIEIVGLLKEEQYKKFRINDPVNPGRTYISGKGLDFPFELDPALECMLHNIRYENQIHTKEIIEKANQVIQEIDLHLALKYSEIKRLFARDFVTERHVSRAIRTLIYARCPKSDERKDFLDRLCGKMGFNADLDDLAAVENEIRAKLLKSGGKAYVPEESSAFLPVSEVFQIIVNAGGIPCYPILLDDDSGRCTEYEANKQILHNELLAHRIHCIEFLPYRNDVEILRDYVNFFHENGFVIIFGTAHSTPDNKPLRVTTRDGEFLDEELAAISYEGASIIAAHQYFRCKGEQGYLDIDGNPRKDRLNEFITLGKAVIHKFISR
ncbi:MAG: hypothetical protein AMS26_19860 [Bacteroides sp. SM23_62]|nr:MAG: hypothetical protein AMS26_19860 [Bacteroides sp. SM23_62]